MRFLAIVVVAVLLLTAGPAFAVIMKLTHLGDVLESDDYIFVASIEKVDPDKPSAVFKLERKLKADPPYERIPVNMTGSDEAKKAGDTKTILDRLDPSRKVVFFVGKRGKNHNAKVFVEGSWFSVHGTEDPADKTVRWAFQNGEPFLRRTFKGTTAEMVKVIEDGLAKKAKPPQADEKEKPGYGPLVEKKCGMRNAECGIKDIREGEPGASATGCSGLHSAFRIPHSALFGVIPSFALVGPLAVIAALFPGVFAKMAVGMKRWRAFLVVASANSTLALIYYLFQTYWPEAIPSGKWFGPKAITIYLMVVAAIGLVWAGLRYRRMATDEPGITQVPGKTELASLLGLSAFAGMSFVLVGLFVDWNANFQLPWREFTFIGISLCVATLYAGYRALTRNVDSACDRRLSLSGETVGLFALLLCGFTTVIGSGSRDPIATVGETGDATAIGPRLVGDVKVFEVKKSHQVLSGITIVGDRLYFGAQFTRSSQEGQLLCLDRETGEEKWRFEGNDDLLPVFCTPTVADGRVYCGEGLHENAGCRMFCVNAADGKPAWDQPIKTTSHTEGAPAVAGGKVFFPAGDEGLIAADAKTGARLWQFPGGKATGIHIDAAPAVGGNRVFVGSGLYSFAAVCLDADSGQQVWRSDLKLRSFSAPLLSGKFVFYGVGTGNLSADVADYPEEGGKNREDKPAGAVVCLEAETGREVWRTDLLRSIHTGLAGDAFSVYAACRDGIVYAFDRKTGQLRWRRGINGPAITAPPAVATVGGMPVAVYAVSQDGNAMCLNPHTGAVLWEKRLPGYHYFPLERDDVLSGPSIVTTPTATGSKRAIYIGAMTVDPDNPAKKTCAVFRFEDEVGGE